MSIVKTSRSFAKFIVLLPVILANAAPREAGAKSETPAEKPRVVRHGFTVQASALAGVGIFRGMGSPAGSLLHFDVGAFVNHRIAVLLGLHHAMTLGAGYRDWIVGWTHLLAFTASGQWWVTDRWLLALGAGFGLMVPVEVLERTIMESSMPITDYDPPPETFYGPAISFSTGFVFKATRSVSWAVIANALAILSSREQAYYVAVGVRLQFHGSR